MATSGVNTFRLNRDQIITQALIKVGAIDPENPSSVTTTQTTNTSNVLNMMVKSWTAIGLELWERKYGIVFLQENQGTYVLGSPGPSGDHATLSTPMSTGYVKTTLSAAVNAGATAVTLTSISSSGTVGTPAVTIATTWNIGIAISTGTIEWHTVNGAPVGTVITLNSAMVGSAIAGSVVYSYQTKLMKPMRVVDAFVRQNAGSDIPVRLISREEYNRFGLKSSAGTSIQAYYDPQENTGHLYIYPVPNDVTQQLFIEFQKPIDDFVNSTDDFDFPQEWGETIVWNLARRLIPDYRVPTETASDIRQFARDSLNMILGWDQENTSLFLAPSNWAYGNGSGSK